MKDGIKLIRLDRKAEVCWAHMPQLTGRIHEWGVRFKQKNIDIIVQRVEASFILGLDTIAIWYAIDGEQIVGHVLILEEEYNCVPVGFISQLAIKPFTVGKAMIDTTWFEAEQWARSKKLDGLVFVTARWRWRAWREMFGFYPWRLVCRRDVAL